MEYKNGKTASFINEESNIHYIMVNNIQHKYYKKTNILHESITNNILQDIKICTDLSNRLKKLVTLYKMLPSLGNPTVHIGYDALTSMFEDLFFMLTTDSDEQFVIELGGCIIKIIDKENIYKHIMVTTDVIWKYVETCSQSPNPYLNNVAVYIATQVIKCSSERFSMRNNSALSIIKRGMMNDNSHIIKLAIIAAIKTMKNPFFSYCHKLLETLVIRATAKVVNSDHVRVPIYISIILNHMIDYSFVEHLSRRNTIELISILSKISTNNYNNNINRLVSLLECDFVTFRRIDNTTNINLINKKLLTTLFYELQSNTE